MYVQPLILWRARVVAMDGEMAQVVVQIDLTKCSPKLPGEIATKFTRQSMKHWGTWHVELGC